MKRLCTLLLCAGMLMGAATGAKAIDFKAKGQWLVGFSLADTSLVHKTRAGAVERKHQDDKFHAAQRVRLQLDAVASESLSGTVFFEIGTTNWGQNSSGGALGADGKIVKLKRAYIDWLAPDTDLKFRMGIQGVMLPNAAGGSAIMDTDAAAVTASYQFNENVALTAMWARPLNDNYNGLQGDGSINPNRVNYLDNLDLFSVMLPITLDGYEITPWVMYGMKGKNAMKGIDGFEGFQNGYSTMDGNLPYSLYPYPGMIGSDKVGGTSKAYGSMFWAGLPLKVTALAPWNFEFDINYGYVEEMGRYDVMRRGNPYDIVHGSTERQGWLVKALAEYKMDWGTPGIFGWYSSGDDGNIKNGSERMPSIAGAGNFTSFIGDGNLAWGSFDDSCDWSMSYAGTWGIGLQLADMSFIEDLAHTFRVAYWGGTNSPSMVKYMENAYSWSEGYGGDGPYLTTNDGLVEFNLVNQWQVYENLELNLELGYVVNLMDKDTWEKSSYYGGADNGSFERQDAWKAQLTFAYTF